MHHLSQVASPKSSTYFEVNGCTRYTTQSLLLASVTSNQENAVISFDNYWLLLSILHVTASLEISDAVDSVLHDQNNALWFGQKLGKVAGSRDCEFQS